MRHGFCLFAAIALVAVCATAGAQQPAATGPGNIDQPSLVQPASGPQNSFVSAARSDPAEPGPDAAELSGTVTDVGGDLIPGATVAVDSADPASHQTGVANDSAFFQFKGLRPGVSYRVTVSAKGFDNWTSSPVVLTAGQFFDVPGIKLKLEDAVSSVTVYSSTEQIATQQVELEEHQRILGIIPNFYVVYDAKDAVPLTTKLKFQMAYRVSIDPVSIVGAATLAGINQAGDTPNYRQGAIGYGERFGATYADGVTDVMFGGAILPSLLHQDPRYFYQGSGTVKSRLIHAMAAPFVCRGDDGRNEINFSSMGGDLISASISNAYYPQSNRGASLVFGGFAISTGERVVSTVVQEFLLKKLTPGAKSRE